LVRSGRAAWADTWPASDSLDEQEYSIHTNISSNNDYMARRMEKTGWNAKIPYTASRDLLSLEERKRMYQFVFFNFFFNFFWFGVHSKLGFRGALSVIH